MTPRELCGESVPNLKEPGKFVCDKAPGHNGQHSARIVIGDTEARCSWSRGAA